MFKRIRNRLTAVRLAWHALTCPPDAPSHPGAFRTHNGARAWLADARGMWHG